MEGKWASFVNNISVLRWIMWLWQRWFETRHSFRAIPFISLVRISVFLYANFSSTCVQSPNIRSTQRLAWPLAMYLRPWQVPGSILAASWWHVHYHSVSNHLEFLWKSSDHRCGRIRKICVYKRRHVWWMGPKNTAWNACGRKSIPPSTNNNAWNVYVWCRNLHFTNECTGQ